MGQVQYTLRNGQPTLLPQKHMIPQKGHPYWPFWERNARSNPFAAPVV